MSVRVRFEGVEYWYLGDDLTDLDHSLAPLDHCDAQGNLTSEAVVNCIRGKDESFAVVDRQGDIMRHHEKIGVVGDLKMIEGKPN